jgi:hypothetical protein
MRHQVIRFGLAEAFFDRALNANQAGTELIFGQLTDAANTTVAEVIDIINLAATITELDQNLDDGQNVFI